MRRLLLLLLLGLGLLVVLLVLLLLLLLLWKQQLCHSLQHPIHGVCFPAAGLTKHAEGGSATSGCHLDKLQALRHGAACSQSQMPDGVADSILKHDMMCL